MGVSSSHPLKWLLLALANWQLAFWRGSAGLITLPQALHWWTLPLGVLVLPCCTDAVPLQDWWTAAVILACLQHLGALFCHSGVQPSTRGMTWCSAPPRPRALPGGAHQPRSALCPPTPSCTCTASRFMPTGVTLPLTFPPNLRCLPTGLTSLGFIKRPAGRSSQRASWPSGATPSSSLSQAAPRSRPRRPWRRPMPC